MAVSFASRASVAVIGSELAATAALKLSASALLENLILKVESLESVHCCDDTDSL